ncbi:hypothetical protein C4K39_5153 [Pseudomonas sessilinigenes]|nr:hypothetical protein C4K39_5153 [Pseudomonas sessilinigenes]
MALDTGLRSRLHSHRNGQQAPWRKHHVNNVMIESG